jgi:hypothetical protein
MCAEVERRLRGGRDVEFRDAVAVQPEAKRKRDRTARESEGLGNGEARTGRNTTPASFR